MRPVGMAEDFGRTVLTQTERWTQRVRRLGIAPE
jgi:hypothetical protein